MRRTARPSAAVAMAAFGIVAVLGAAPAFAAPPPSAVSPAPMVEAPAAAGKAIKVGTMRLEPCDHHAYCGTLARPIDPTGHVAGTIDIFVKYFPRTDPSKPSLGTMVTVEGGPGYPSANSVGEYLPTYRPLRERRELVMVDARGTGKSAVINCEPLQRMDDITVKAVGECGRSLGDRSSLFTTAFAADDLDAVLDALGVGKIDLYGDSYGTWFSQVFAVRYGERLRSVVLDSAYPVLPVEGESAWYPTYAPAVRDKFRLGCERTPSCAALGGSTIDRIEAVLDSLRRKPFRASAMDATGAVHHFTADPGMLALVMFASAPAKATVRELDAASRAFMAGDRKPLLRLMAETLYWSESRNVGRSPRYFSYGMFAAVNCQDLFQVYDLAKTPAERKAERDRKVAQKKATKPGLYSPFTIDEFLGLPIDLSYVDMCLRWPSPPKWLPAGQAVPKDARFPKVPTLVFSGDLDAITTEKEGAIVASFFPNGRQIVAANQFHVTALRPETNDCMPNILRRFVETLDPGDTSCAAKLPEVRLPPLFARRAAEVPPATALKGNKADKEARRLAAAVVLTAGDIIARVDSTWGDRTVGLRGGKALIEREGIWYYFNFDRVRWAEDVTVSGTLAWPNGPGTATATLTFEGPRGRSGTVKVEWPEQVPLAEATLSGRIGGAALAARMPAP